MTKKINEKRISAEKMMAKILGTFLLICHLVKGSINRAKKTAKTRGISKVF